MDRVLNALVNLDVPADVVRISVRGSLDQESRPDLIHIIRHIRGMGIRSHIRVNLSQAALVESSALAGLRGDLNALDFGALPGLKGAGVSLDLRAVGDESGFAPGATEQPLMIVGDAAIAEDAGGLSDGLLLAPDTLLEEVCGQPLADYTDEELLAASDSLFALLDTPTAFAGADLLGRYNDIGQELLQRKQGPEKPVPAGEGQAAS